MGVFSTPEYNEQLRVQKGVERLKRLRKSHRKATWWLQIGSSFIYMLMSIVVVSFQLFVMIYALAKRFDLKSERNHYIAIAAISILNLASMIVYIYVAYNQKWDIVKYSTMVNVVFIIGTTITNVLLFKYVDTSDEITQNSNRNVNKLYVSVIGYLGLVCFMMLFIHIKLRRLRVSKRKFSLTISESRSESDNYNELNNLVPT